MAARHAPGQQGGDEELNAVCAEPKLFVGGLRYEVTQDDLRAHYERYGPLRSASLLMHHDSGKSKGCAMVLFDAWTDAEAAVAAESGVATDLSAPRPAVVKFADPQRNEHGVLCGVTPKKLFIGQVRGARRGAAGCGRLAAGARAWARARHGRAHTTQRDGCVAAADARIWPAAACGCMTVAA
mgnify:CR=1 FL=1